MAYDQALDVSSFNENFSNEKSRVSVSIWSYNGGQNKIQLSRENFVDNTWNFTKLGRMTKAEMEGVLPIIIKAVEGM